MSLILEALKKSEQQRRLGEVPTLGTPVMATRQRRSLLPALSVLIVLGLAVAWWLHRPQTSAPTAVAARDAAAVAPSTPTATPVTAAPAPVAAPPAAPRERPEAASNARESVAVAASPTQAPPPRPAAAPPVQSGSPGLEKIAIPAATATAAAPTQAPPAPVAAAPAANPAPAADTTATKSAPAPVAPPPAAPAAGTLPLIWELPFATRKNLPEMNLSMHVFGNEPAQRFVILNGERRVAGDDVDGVHVVEIRADGVVLELEGQRFLLPRGGR